MDELLPCPFCGAAAERVDNGPTQKQVAYAHSWGEDVDDGGSFIHCTQCDASSTIHYERRENLLSSWNDRADDWRLISSAPWDTDVLSGWMSFSPKEEWKIEVGWAGHSNTCSGGYSNGWQHGNATHWRPLPTLPKEYAE